MYMYVWSNLANFVTKFRPSKQPRLMKARHTRETDRCFFRNSLFEKQSVYTATYDEHLLKASIIPGGGVGIGLGMDTTLKHATSSKLI